MSEMYSGGSPNEIAEAALENLRQTVEANKVGDVDEQEFDAVYRQTISTIMELAGMGGECDLKKGYCRFGEESPTNCPRTCSGDMWDQI